MKKWMALVLAVLMFASLSVCACADGENDVYALLTDLVAGREFTLTVTAEDVAGLEEFLAPYGSVSCTVKQEEGTIVLDVTTEGEAYLKATATAEGVTLSTNFIELDDVAAAWDVLKPNVALTRDEKGTTLKIGMTGPNMELINFSAKIKGFAWNDYTAEISVGFITGPGAVYSLWDSISDQDGETYRDFAFTWDESELMIEATGTEEVATEDGTQAVRSEEFTVYVDDDEIGTLVLRTELVVR